jgi:hypothetical protein
MEKWIHTKTIIDIETGVVLYDDGYFYSGPIAEVKGPKVKTVAPPPPSTEEVEQRQLSNLVSKMALGEQGYEVYNEGGQLQLRKRALTPEEQQQSDIEAKMQRRFMEELDRMPGQVSPEQQKALDELYGAEQSKMDEELQRFAVEQSGARGLSMNDTPLAREVLLAKGRGQTELGAARASSKLNFAEKERMFNQGLSQWRSDLQQQRLSNLMGAGGQAGNAAIGFMNARANLKPSMFQGAGGGSQAGAIAGGVGAAVGGIAMAF